MRSMLKKLLGDGFFEGERGFGAAEGRAGASCEVSKVPTGGPRRGDGAR